MKAITGAAAHAAHETKAVNSFRRACRTGSLRVMRVSTTVRARPEARATIIHPKAVAGGAVVASAKAQLTMIQ